MENFPPTAGICSKSTCKNPLPPYVPDGRNFKLCVRCRTRDATSKAARGEKRKRVDDGGALPAPSIRTATAESRSDITMISEEVCQLLWHTQHKFIWNGQQTSTQYSDSQAMFDALRLQFKQDQSITFCGAFILANDPLVTDKERVQMMASEVWKVIGYRFTYVSIITRTASSSADADQKCAGQSPASKWPSDTVPVFAR